MDGEFPTSPPRPRFVRAIFRVQPPLDTTAIQMSIRSVDGSDLIDVHLCPPLSPSYFWTACILLRPNISIEYTYTYVRGPIDESISLVSYVRKLTPTGYSCHIQDREKPLEDGDHVWSTEGFVARHSLSQKTQLHLLFELHKEKNLIWFDEEYQASKLVLFSNQVAKCTSSISMKLLHDDGIKPFLKCCLLSSALPRKCDWSPSPDDENGEFKGGRSKTHKRNHSHPAFTRPPSVENPLCIHVEFYGKRITPTSPKDTLFSSSSTTTKHGDDEDDGHEFLVGTAFVTQDLIGHGCGQLVLQIVHDAKVIGTCRLHYVLITPFFHPSFHHTHIPRHNMFTLRSKTEFMGHRGSGANRALSAPDKQGKTARTSTYENTMLSFETAVSKGRQWIEFDVQLTADSIPVVYHDLTIPLDLSIKYNVPLHELTYKQFRKLSKSIASGGSSRMARGSSMGDLRDVVEQSKLQMRRMRVFESRQDGEASVTVYGRHVQVRNEFPRLKDLFTHLPTSLGFDIELKYVSREEAGSIILAESNHFVNEILQVVFDHNHPERKIFFSSFDPDICVALIHKQTQYPVFFLIDVDEGGLTRDKRKSSFHSCVEFVQSYGMMGIITKASCVLNHGLGDLIESYKNDTSLLIGTFGADNNDPAKIQEQIELGVDFIISDHVVAL